MGPKSRKPILISSIALTLAAVLILLAPMPIAWARKAKNECRVAVLMFHSIIPDSMSPSRYAMRESDFVSQIEEAKARGTTFFDVDRLLEFIGPADRTPWDGPAVCPYENGALLLTFDMDGASYHAETMVKHLERWDVPALFFVPTRFIDQGQAVGSEEIRRLADKGATFGSHTEWHRDMRTVEPHELLESLASSRASLQSLTDQDIRTVAAPGGRYDDEVIETVRQAGFRSFFNSDPCYLEAGSSPFRICRVEIRGDRGITAIEALNVPGRVAKQQTAFRLKRSIERLLGPTGWRMLSTVRTAFQ